MHCRKLIAACWPIHFPGIEETRRAIRRETEDDLAISAKLGFVVHELTPEQRDEWRRATAPVTGKLIRALGGRSAEIYQTIERAKAEYRATRLAVVTPSAR